MRAGAGADWRQNTEEPADQSIDNKCRTGRIATGNTKVGTLLQYKVKQTENIQEFHTLTYSTSLCVCSMCQRTSVCVCVGRCVCVCGGGLCFGSPLCVEWRDCFCLTVFPLDWHGIEVRKKSTCLKFVCRSMIYVIFVRAKQHWNNVGGLSIKNRL